MSIKVVSVNILSYLILLKLLLSLVDQMVDSIIKKERETNVFYQYKRWRGVVLNSVMSKK